MIDYDLGERTTDENETRRIRCASARWGGSGVECKLLMAETLTA